MYTYCVFSPAGFLKYFAWQKKLFYHLPTFHGFFHCPKINQELWLTETKKMLLFFKQIQSLENLISHILITNNFTKAVFKTQAAFLVQKYFAQLFSTYSLALKFFAKRIAAQKLLVKCCWNWLKVEMKCLHE